MDQPSGSRAPSYMKLPNSARMALAIDKSTPSTSASRNEAQRSRHIHKNIHTLITECELRIRNYLKLQRLAIEARDYNIFDVDDDSSNTSDSSISLSSSAEDIFASTSTPQLRAQRQYKKERLTIGSWLFLASVEGGWSYETTKRFLIKEYGVKCLRSRTLSDRLAIEGDFKAIVKFRTSEELRRIVMSLKRRKIFDKFIFLSFDKMPLPCDDSESESEDEMSTNPYSMIPKGI